MDVTKVQTSRFRVNTPGVVAEAIEQPAGAEHEAIMVNLESGTYYSLRGDGALLWQAVADGMTVGAIVDRVAAATGVERGEAETGVRSFCDVLVLEGLVVADDSEGGATETVDFSNCGPDVLEPRLERHVDMQDLILLDPVHEVDDRGWPHPRPTDD